MTDIDKLVVKVSFDSSEADRNTRKFVLRQRKAAREIVNSWSKADKKIVAGSKAAAAKMRASIASVERRHKQAAEKSSRAWGTTFSSVRKTAAPAILSIGTAAGFTGKKMVDLASDAEQVESRFSVLFGKTAVDAERKLNAIAEAVGRSRTELKASASDFQGFFVGLGKSAEESANLSAKMVQLSLDFASFNNISDDEAAGRFISALSGSSEVLDRYGINTKQAAIQQELLAQGIKKSASEITEQEKVTARLSIIMKSMTQQGAVGDAARTADQYANAMKRLRAQVVELGESMGSTLIPALGKLADGWVAVIKNARAYFDETDKRNNELTESFLQAREGAEKLVEQARQFSSGEGKALEATINKILKASVGLAEQGRVLDPFAQLADGKAATHAALITKNLQDLVPAMKKAGVSADELQSALDEIRMERNPLIVEGFDAVVAALKATNEEAKKVQKSQDEVSAKSAKAAEFEKALADQQKDGMVLEQDRANQRKKILDERIGILQAELAAISGIAGQEEKRLSIAMALRGAYAEFLELQNKQAEGQGDSVKKPFDPFASGGGGIDSFGGEDGAQMKLQEIADRNKSELALLEEKFAAENELLILAKEQELITEEVYGQLLNDVRINKEETLTNFLDNEEKKRLKLKEAAQKQTLNSLNGFLQNVQTASAAGGRKGFELAKIAAIAQAAINIPTSISSSFRAGSEIGGPYVGAAFAAVAGAAQLANLNAIRSKTYSGGGGGGGGGGGAAPAAVTPTSPESALSQEENTTSSSSGRNGGTTTIQVETPGLSSLDPDSIITAGSAQQVLDKVNEGLRQQGEDPLTS